MASTEADPAVATASTQADKNVESKDKDVSAEIDLYEKFLDPFAEGSKFTPINEQASEDDLTSVGSESVAVEEAALSGDLKDVAANTETVAKEDAKEHENGVIKTTPKKRGAAKNDDESPVAKKKRTTAKIKKEAKDAEDNGDAAGGNLPLTPPVTPPKKGRGRKASNTANADVKRSVPKPKGGKKIKATESAEHSAEGPNSQESPTTTKLGTPRKRAAVTKDKAVARGLPTSMEQASDADKMLLHMKDVENKPWAEIRKMWKVMTSQETASSTLPNRYNRLKANLMVLKDGDATRLLSAKAEIELEFTEYVAKFNQDKWAKVQKAMEAKGTTDKYPSLFLQKKFEELSAAGAVASAAADDTEMAEGESAEEEENGEEEEAVKAEE